MSEVTVQVRAWEKRYNTKNGFWQFRFRDGGILNWYSETTGRLSMAGKPTATSFQRLSEKVRGICWEGELAGVEKAIRKYIPEETRNQIPIVSDCGWRRKIKEGHARFDFTDGAVLHFQSTGITIQGTPSDATLAALEALPNPFWASLDKLTEVLKQIFPDWRVGLVSQPDSTDQGESADSNIWSPLENALGWHRLWPDDREFRVAASQKDSCQKILMEDWASILTHHQGKRHLLTHAPTGLGKTIAALVPALAWVAEEPDRRRIYYLVNRLTQHENPLRELKNGLAVQFEAMIGQPLRVVDIVARGSLCHHPEKKKLPNDCRAARNEADFSLLPSYIASWHEVKQHLCQETCPYHTLQGLMAKAHLVIGDFWWLFSQAAQRGHLAKIAGFSQTHSILIVDEAHNLPMRVREELDVAESVARIRQSLQDVPIPVQDCLTPVIEALDRLKTDKGIASSKLLAVAGGIDAVTEALDLLVDDEEQAPSIHLPERILRFLQQPDESVVIYASQDLDGKKKLIFRLIDPMPILKTGYRRVHSSMSMSGTLAAPADSVDELRYQIPLFGLPPSETLARRYASPFPLRNQRWIYCPDTLGTYRHRRNHLSDYAKHIVSIGKVTPGVTAVFFSSYAFLQQVKAAIEDSTERALIVTENQGAGESDDTLNPLMVYEHQLKQAVERNGRAYLFSVYQGKLSEGADFPDNLIKSVVCVSIPMDYPALFHERLQTLYVQNFKEIAEMVGDDSHIKAKEYALDRVSLSLVLQACGRGIRSETDKCTFILLDERYNRYDWRRFLEPRPYNIRQPSVNIADFHSTPVQENDPAWDSALLKINRTD